jgi:hypothetical protein
MLSAVKFLAGIVKYRLTKLSQAQKPPVVAGL